MELKAENPDLNIEILGINMKSQSQFNSLMTDERRLPWLQDTSEESLWEHWQVTHRDVRILDSQNRLVAVFNLTRHDLADPNNREALKELFLSAARIVDVDNDKLPDDWEQQYLGTTAPYAPDPDGDGRDNFTEYAFGTDPASPTSALPVRPWFILEAGRTYFSVTFRRRAGSALDYFAETSSDLEHWSASATDIKPKRPARNLYDGTGTSEATYSLTKPVGESPFRFIRVRAVPRQ